MQVSIEHVLPQVRSQKWVRNDGPCTCGEPAVLKFRGRLVTSVTTLQDQLIAPRSIALLSFPSVLSLTS